MQQLAPASRHTTPQSHRRLTVLTGAMRTPLNEGRAGENRERTTKSVAELVVVRVHEPERPERARQ